MKLLEHTRRVFLAGAAALIAAPPVVQAFPRGGSPFGRSIIGLTPTDLPFMNYFKSADSFSSSTVSFPGTLNADGYPTTTPTTDIVGFTNLQSNYYGRYRIQFSGRGSIDLAGQFIVYSGSGFIANLGDLITVLELRDVTNPVVEFAFGTLVSGAAKASVGNEIVLTVGSTANVGTGDKYTVQGVTGTTEANGLWTVTVVDGTHLQLQGSTFVHAYVSGGEAIRQVSRVQFNFKPIGTFSSMSNAILCRKADIDGTNAFGLQAGYQINADLISLVRTLKPYAVRTLVLGGVTNSTASDYSKRPQTTAFYYTDYATFPPSYWAGGSGTSGAISRGASDAYTCSNPSGSGTGAYADGEIVIGAVDLANLTNTPTLQLGTRGAKPVLNSNGSIVGVVGGTIASGKTLNLIFTGSYITGSPYHLAYTTVAGDVGNSSTLAHNLWTAIQADTTLQAANISADVSSNILQFIYNRNAGSGTTITFTTTGSETLSVGTAQIGDIPATTVCTFTYSTILGGWIMVPNALVSGMATPPEVLCEIGNRANVNVWFQIPILYSLASVASLTATVRDTLNSNLTALFELDNEIWNFAEFITSTARNLGASLGFTFQGGVGQYEGFFGLRVRQFMAQAATTWTATRSRTTLKCLMSHSFAAEDASVGGGTQTSRFNGAELTTSNATYAALGGVGGTAGTTYTSVGQRPIDFCDGVSYAHYFSGSQLAKFPANWTGLVSYYSNILQAGKDYATGSTTVALNAVDTDLRSGTVNGVAGETLATDLAASQRWETVYATYDTPRAGLGLAKLGLYCYEGGYESAVVNSFADLSTPTDLATQFSNNGWDTSAYGASNTVVAQQVVNVFFAYKNSSQFQTTAKLALSNIATAHAGRIAYPSWLQISGPSIWAMYPGDTYSTTPYTSYNAVVQYNS